MRVAVHVPYIDALKIMLDDNGMTHQLRELLERPEYYLRPIVVRPAKRISALLRQRPTQNLANVDERGVPNEGVMDQSEKDQGASKDVRRAPLPASIPRPAKRASNRQSPLRITAHVRVIAAALEEEQHDYIRRKLGMKLGKYATSIERISVRVTDVNGPRGGVDQRCTIKVVLSGLPSVVIERRHTHVRGALDAGLQATSEAIRRILARRRMKPLHRGRARGGIAA
jgi:hypothetical protein